MGTMTVEVEVEVRLDSFDDDELISEIEVRGYSVESEPILSPDQLDRYEIDALITLLDNQEKTVYSMLLRDKLFKWRNTV